MFFHSRISFREVLVYFYKFLFISIVFYCHILGPILVNFTKCQFVTIPNSGGSRIFTGGRQPSERGAPDKILLNAPENCMKSRKIWPLGGGRHLRTSRKKALSEIKVFSFFLLFLIKVTEGTLGWHAQYFGAAASYYLSNYHFLTFVND